MKRVKLKLKNNTSVTSHGHVQFCGHCLMFFPYDTCSPEQNSAERQPLTYFGELPYLMKSPSSTGDVLIKHKRGCRRGLCKEPLP